MWVKVAWRSLMHRRGGVLLALLSVAVSLFVLLGVEQVRSQAKSSFGRTVSGVDLIVGARTGQLNLLLYTVFRIGSPSNNIDWHTYTRFAQHPQVAWSIPLSLGDSHRGYRVVGTSAAFFEHYRYGPGRELAFAAGGPFAGRQDLVLGSEVAAKLGYSPGEQLVLAHGLGRSSFSLHSDHPFTAVGVLKPTGTPVDQALYISLEGMELIHRPHEQDLTPVSITAFMLGLNSRMASFQVQWEINQYAGEPLMAILPGVALSELWQMLRSVEKLLLLMSALVVLASLLGLCILLLSSLRERQREISLLRAIGAGPLYLFLLIQVEALLVLLLGAALALAALWIALRVAAPFLAEQYGVYLSGITFAGQTPLLLGVVLLGALMAALLPALMACRQSLGRGLGD